jgi:hypothetical protein
VELVAIPIRRGVLQRFGADHAVRARTVLHDDRLLPLILQELRKAARGDVACAAWAERHDDADRFAGIRLRQCGCDRQQKAEYRPGSANESEHGFL